jgi:SAM-dependent methyltransferase
MDLKCNVCDSRVFEKIHELGTAQYAICKDCGHVFQLQYEDPSYYRNLPCTFPKDYDDHCKRRAAYIADFVSPSRSHMVLDIGSGAGGVMRELQKLGIRDVFGCTLEKVNDTRIRSLDIESDSLPFFDFDLGIMCHVLEHFRDPVDVLKKVRGVLRPRGRLYIEVPSFHWAEVRIKTVFTPEHMSFFTASMLVSVCKAAGFKVIKIHESKYWGNIKAIVVPDQLVDISIKKLEYKKVLRYHSLVKWQYPFYRLSRRLRTIGPND